VLGVRDGVLDAAVAAPPVDGAANEALKDLLAQVLGLRRNQVEIVTGSSGRTKIIEVPLSAEETRKRLVANHADKRNP